MFLVITQEIKKKIIMQNWYKPNQIQRKKKNHKTFNISVCAYSAIALEDDLVIFTDSITYMYHKQNGIII